MPLNHDAVADLDQNTDEVLLNDISPKVIFKTEVEETYEEKKEDPIASSLLKKLPTLDSSFKMVQNGATKIVELEDVASEIMDSDEISQSEAELISTAFEGFFDQVRLSEFTRTPSKTNLAFTKRFIEGKISLAKENFHSKFKTFLEEPLDDALDVLEELQEEYIPALREELSKLQASATLLKDSIANNPHLILADGYEFVDLRKIALQAPDKAVHLLKKPEWKTLACAILNFQAIWKEYGVLRSVLVGVLQKKTLQEIFECEHMAGCSMVTLTISEFTEIMSSTYLMDVIDQMYVNVCGHASKVEELRDECKNFMEDQEKSQTFIVENGKEIQEMAAAFHHYSEAVATLMLLVPNAKVLVAGFASFS